MSSADNPYVGPRPFEREESDLFFGRTAEAHELLSLVVADQAVLLYAASGAGKSSLLRAGLTPRLEAEPFDVLPIARLSRALDEATLASVRNVFTLSALSSWTGEGSAAVPEPSLAEFLIARPHRRDADGWPVPRAIIFDQFEELFTAHSALWRHRESFVEQLAELLDFDPLTRVVLAIREDYLAQLDALAPILPGSLRARYRLERFSPEQALEAVVQPVERTSRRYAPGVARALVASLLTQRVEVGRGQTIEVEGEFIEPVQLQVTCQSLWSELPDDIEVITEDHLSHFGDVTAALGAFYDAAVHAAATASGVRQRRIRRWIADSVITAGGTRGTVYRGATETEGLPNAAIDVLENQHLLRAEWRAGARWYELTHDRLIEPIVRSNAHAERTRRLRALAAWSVLGAVAVIVLVAVAALTLSGGGGTAAPACATLRARHGPATTVAFNVDGSQLAAGYEDGAVVLWNLASCRPGGTFVSDATPVSALAFSPLGLFARGGLQDLISIVNPVTVKTVTAFVVPGRVYGLAFSPNGSELATATDSGATIIAVNRGRSASLGSRGAVVTSVAWNPDGRFVVAASKDGVVNVYDARSGALVTQVRTPPGTSAVAVSPDGRQLAVGGSAGVELFSASDPRQVRSLRLPSSAGTTDLAFSPDASRIAIAGSSGRAEIVDLATGRVAAYPVGGAAEGVAFSPDGRRLAIAGSSGAVQVESVSA